MKLVAMLNAEGQVVVYFLRPTAEVTVPGMAPADLVVAYAVMTRTDAGNFAQALNRLAHTEVGRP